MFSVFVSAQTLENLDKIAPFNEGLAAVQKNNQWGFINTDGELVIDFRSDLTQSSENENYPVFKDNRSLITQQKNGITYFGYIDETGATVIEPQYLNATNFMNGRAIVLKLDKIIAGQNDALGKNVVFYEYNEVLISPEGKIIAFLSKEGKNIVLDKDYLRKPPPITFKQLSPSLFAQMNKSKHWQIKKIED
jgi:hypothetical protein